MKADEFKMIMEQIRKHKIRISTERDSLRNILTDLESELESFDYGIDLLDEAIQKLSEFV